MPRTFSESFDFLSQKVRILAVDSDFDALERYLQGFSSCELYHVDTAVTRHDAELLLRNQTYHFCLLGLALKDSAHDDLYLLRKYGRTVRFMVISGKTCLETGCTIGLLGAQALSRPISPRWAMVLAAVNKAFLAYLVSPIVVSVEDDYHVSLCRDVLRTSIPDSVSEWALKAGIAERYLRQKWAEWIGDKPSRTLFLYHVFSEAFSESWADQFGGPRPKRLPKALYKRWQNYYAKNADELDAFLQRRLASSCEMPPDMFTIGSAKKAESLHIEKRHEPSLSGLA